MIDPSRVFILSMFCNKPLYVKEKEAVERTWGQDAVKAGFKHIFYTETNDNTRLSGNTLLIKCKGDLVNTYKKTCNAIKYVEDRFDYDYIVKTNVSTYVNVKILKQVLEYMSEKDPDSIYGNKLILKGRNLYIRGDFTIIPRKSCVEMLEVYKETRALRNQECDDRFMFHVLNEKRGLTFARKLKNIPSATISDYDYEKVKNACAVRLKTLKSDNYQIVTRMHDFHNAVKRETREFLFKPIFMLGHVYVISHGQKRQKPYDQAIRLYLKRHERKPDQKKESNEKNSLFIL